MTGKYRRGEPAPEGTRLHGREIDDDEYDRMEALEAFAEERGVTLLEVAIGGLAAQEPVASVIAGATKPEQVRANAAAGAGSRRQATSRRCCPARLAAEQAVDRQRGEEDEHDLRDHPGVVVHPVADLRQHGLRALSRPTATT